MQTTYTKARENLASLMDKVVHDREVVVIERRNKPSVALIAQDELDSLMETAHLLRSPRNAARLLSALEWSKSRDKAGVEPHTVDGAIAALVRELGIDKVGKEKES